MNVDWRLYLVVDDALLADRPLEDVARAAAAGGVTVVQLRHKSADMRRGLAAAELLRWVTLELGLPLIINDRVDVALAVRADGVHLGPEDLPVPVARRLLGAGSIIGASTGTVEEARLAVAEGANYLGVGSLFGTQTKPDAGDPIGTDGLREIVKAVSIPVVGIGGVNAANVASVIEAGAAGAAVVSAILSAPNVQSAAREIRSSMGQRERSF